MFDRPHNPTRSDGSTNEERETKGAEPDHETRLRALRDTEDYRSEEREEKHRTKVSHERFLPLARECASTAVTTFRRPATTMNLVP